MFYQYCNSTVTCCASVVCIDSIEGIIFKRGVGSTGQKSFLKADKISISVRNE